MSILHLILDCMCHNTQRLVSCTQKNYVKVSSTYQGAMAVTIRSLSKKVKMAWKRRTEC